METVHDDTTYGSSSNNNSKKLYVIGDIHGSIDEFNTLVSKLQYNYDAGDRIVLAGDLVMRGPDSVGVIRRAKELKALCVRGNHDDKVVRMKTYLRSGQPVFRTGIIPEGPVMDPLEFDNYHMDVAQNMTDADYEYLANCPMILAIPSQQALFVHAGVNPYRSLDNQQPFTIMNVRTIEDNLSPTKKKGGEEWSDIWNVQQEKNDSTFPPEYRKIFYGHAAGNGLQLKNYTFGVDTGCVYGRQLTALEVKTGQLTQVSCKEHYKN
ncbi:Metallo-dependent phosphatase-like protein [Zychaea mexicana]|uniref:Metallo-dependent phosphatase-like protein n=1 Tax=Zychaea mexicana TaxID=64656 RepID=UPI0022FDCED1|nr:Metallo-dependent phosphatase-like protein [Zychaea mexicana]KAI9495552.1 Metallo-dependent phosphatase-like protein [Zychaea mexicana]